MTEQEYKQEIEYIYTRFPSFQRVGKVAYKPGIQTMQFLSSVMGDPHKSFFTIHIAGTNGKGSTSHMLASALMQLSPQELYSALARNIKNINQEYPDNLKLHHYFSSAGGHEQSGCNELEGKVNSGPYGRKYLKVGLYTSPHLWDFRERVKVSDGENPDAIQMIEKEYVYNFLKTYRPIFEEHNASFFEITTALAFKYFKDQDVDIAIIECGLGGRLDSTNIIKPLLSIITNIGLDHCEYLGYEYTQIASEKAGIIKEGIPVIVGELGTRFSSLVRLHSDNKQINNNILTQHKQSLFCFVKNDTTSIKKVFVEKALRMHAPIIFAEHPDQFSLFRSAPLASGFDMSGMDLGGDCQKKNIKAVIIALSRLLNTTDPPIWADLSSDSAEMECEHGTGGFEEIVSRLKKGISNAARITGLHGRWEHLYILPDGKLGTGLVDYPQVVEVVCDTGHNAHGFSISVPQIMRQIASGPGRVGDLQVVRQKHRRLIMIFGVVADKDLDSIIPILPKKEAYYYFVNASGSRALPAQKLSEKMFANGFKGEVVIPDIPEGSSVMKGLHKYLGNDAQPGDFVFIGGSSYVVAELEVWPCG